MNKKTGITNCNQIIINFRVVRELIKLRFHNLMAFRLGFFGPFLVDSSLFLVQMLVFKAVYDKVERIGTWERGDMMIFIGTFSLINALNMIIYFFGVNGISQSIKSGEMDLYLTKPVSPLLRFTFERVNPGSIPLLALSICIISYGVGLNGIKLNVRNVSAYIVCVILMTILWYEMEVIMRSISFFVISAENMLSIEAAGIDLCMKIPGVALKGGYKLLFYCILPYGIMATFPTMSLTGKDSVNMWMFGIGIVVLFGFITAIIWKKGLRHYNSVSS